MLHAGLRTATLRCDEHGQAVLLNALYRSYLNDNLIDQAKLLSSKTKFPESAPNTEVARFYYSLGAS
jgi:26S proteasome regulatory subunit N3